mgnify:CR=1 FL=1
MSDYQEPGISRLLSFLDVEVQLLLGFQKIPHLDRVVTEEEHKPPVSTKSGSVRNCFLGRGHQLVRLEVRMLNALFGHFQLAHHAASAIAIRRFVTPAATALVMVCATPGRHTSKARKSTSG